MAKQIQDAYIVAATRTPVGKAPRGMFKNVRPDDMLAQVLRNVLKQCPQLDPALIGDVIVGCAMPEAEQGMNVARIALLLAGLPNRLQAGRAKTVDRQPRHAVRQPSQQQCNARHIHPLFRFRHGAAGDDIADQSGIELRALF